MYALGGTPLGQPVTSTPLVGGADARVAATIHAMQRIARDSMREPIVLDTAADIVQDVDGKDQLAQIRRLRSWLSERVRFLADPLIDGDVIRTPALMLSKLERDGLMQGDCDDVATLSASLAHAMGLRARYVTLGFNGPKAPFMHVYTEVLGPTGRWHELDVTETDEAKAQNPPTRRAEWPAIPDALGATLDVRGLLGIVETVILGYQAYKGIRDLFAEVLDDV